MAIEGKYQAELETWKMEAAVEIWKDSVNCSRSCTRKRYGSLTRTQRVSCDAVENKAVSWQTMKIPDS
jgi:hypothetical protein